MKNVLLMALLVAIALCFSTASGATGDAENAALEEAPLPMALSVNGVVLPVLWEQNEAVNALFALLEQGEILIETHLYGGFEQVGPLPESLPEQDSLITAVPGDIMLYAADQLVIFFGNNAWTYTKLGHIDAMTEKELTALLAVENTTVTLTRLIPDNAPCCPGS